MVAKYTALHPLPFQTCGYLCSAPICKVSRDDIPASASSSHSRPLWALLKPWKTGAAPGERRARWRASVIPAPREAEAGGSRVLGSSELQRRVERASALGLAPTWGSRGSLGAPGCLRRGDPAQAGHGAGQTPRAGRRWDRACERRL